MPLHWQIKFTSFASKYNFDRMDMDVIYDNYKEQWAKKRECWAQQLTGTRSKNALFTRFLSLGGAKYLLANPAKTGDMVSFRLVFIGTNDDPLKPMAINY